MAMLVKWVTKWSNCQLPSPKDAVANDYTNPTVDKNKKKRQKRNDDTLGIVATNPTRDLLHVERSLPKDSVAISATFFWHGSFLYDDDWKEAAAGGSCCCDCSPGS